LYYRDITVSAIVIIVVHQEPLKAVVLQLQYSTSIQCRTTIDQPSNRSRIVVLTTALEDIVIIVITSAEEVMIYPAFVFREFVCMLAG